MSAFRPDGWTTPELAQAVERGQLELHYQPVVDLRSGGIVGAEALLRWRHPTLGLLPPGQFLPVVESSGLMPERARRAGAWLLDQAAQAGTPALQVAVGYDFHADFDLLEQLLGLPEASGVVNPVPDRLAVVWGSILVPTHVGYLLDQDEADKAAEAAYAGLAGRGLYPHHALADALALGARYLAVHGPTTPGSP